MLAVPPEDAALNSVVVPPELTTLSRNGRMRPVISMLKAPFASVVASLETPFWSLRVTAADAKGVPIAAIPETIVGVAPPPPPPAGAPPLPPPPQAARARQMIDRKYAPEK